MTQVQLSVSGTQSDVTATSRVTVTDPAAEVVSVGFHVTGRGRRRTGPFAADRALPGGVYEKDLLLDAKELTRLQAEIVLLDGAVLTSQNMTFGTRFEPLNVAAGAINSLTVTPQPSRLDIAIVLGSAFIWKCYCRKGAQPTVDGSAGARLDERYLRFDEAPVAFSMGADAGSWNIVALGYNNAGQPGPRRSATVQVTA